ncbi:MAG: efflux RND transporter periplasmic adaptor subunit [bacterium]|nr:efflux RND transporter periplasmic adaptor subunit [bacterium]
MTGTALQRLRFVCLALVFALAVGAAGCGGNSVSGANEDAGDDAAAAEQTKAAEGDGKKAEEAADGEKPEPEKKPKKKKKEASTSVNVSEVTVGDLVVPVLAEGTIRARNAADVKFEVAGRLDQVFVKEGQRVKKGQKLARIDDREYVLAMEEARSRYLQGLGQLAVEEEDFGATAAERNLNAKKTELDTMERDGLITRQERLDRELALGIEAVREGAYRRELLEVRSGIHTARADMARLELNLEKTIVRAPFNGVISNLELGAGERVQTGELLARLVDRVNVEAVIGVLESDLAGVEVGRPVLIEIPALDRTVRGKVDVVSPEIDADSRTCSVLVRLRSAKGTIKPGMFVRASIAGAILPETTLVPREAVLTRDGRPVVFRVEEKRSKWVYVQLGLRNDHMVEIKRVDQGGPLDPGTQVVVSNHLTLTHDAKVKVRKTIPLADPWSEETEKN